MELGDLSSGSFEVLAAHASVAERVIRTAAELRRFHAESMADSLLGEQSEDRYGYKNAGGAALIPVIGTLIPRGPVGLHRYGATSYEALRSELRRATADTAASVIVMMIDSGGGYVTGVDVTGDAIQTARRIKPVIAVVEGNCFSAAYWLASQCDAIILSTVSEIGSVGVLLMHVDMSKAMSASGIKVTYIHAGARKVDGNPFEPLPDAVKADLERKVEAQRQLFAEAVVAGRDRLNLGLQDVLDTEAGCYGASEAIALGLADRIGSLDQVLDALPAAAAMRRPTVGAGRLAGAPLSTLLALPPAAVVVPIAAPASLEPETQGISALDARARIVAILSHELAQGEGRAVAEMIALKTDLNLEQAVVFLEITATTRKEPALTLDQEMAADKQPLLGSGAGSSQAMTPFQEGAFTAARLLGKDPIKAAAKAGRQGGSSWAAPEPPEVSNAAVTAGEPPHAAEILKRL